jgi:flavin-dependent dehydrogenase
MIIAADGVNSAIGRKMGMSLHLSQYREHMAIAARAYFKGAENLEGGIEIHYEKQNKSLL